jgi:hypothetical protein
MLAFPAPTAIIVFSGHSDSCTTSALAARRAEYQASQNPSGPAAGMGGSASAVRWSSTDERALEEAVFHPGLRMGLKICGTRN